MTRIYILPFSLHCAYAKYGTYVGRRCLRRCLRGIPELMELYLASTTSQKTFVISHGENHPSTAHIWLCCFIFCVMALGARFAITIATPRIYRSATDAIRRALALATRKRPSGGSTHAGEPWFAIRVVLMTANSSSQNTANLFQKLPMHGAQASFCSLLICPLEQFTRTRHQSAHSSLAVLPSTRMTLPCSRKQIGLQGYMRRPCDTLARVAIAQLLQPLEC